MAAWHGGDGPGLAHDPLVWADWSEERGADTSALRWWLACGLFVAGDGSGDG